jgi:hypothetical protein
MSCSASTRCLSSLQLSGAVALVAKSAWGRNVCMRSGTCPRGRNDEIRQTAVLPVPAGVVTDYVPIGA